MIMHKTDCFLSSGWLRVMLVIVVLFSLGGCILDPARGTSSDDPLTPLAPENPSSVLFNFSLSHTLKDASIYAACLSDESYEFKYHATEGSDYISWNKNDDVASMEAMFADPDVQQVSFQYTVLDSSYSDSLIPEYTLNIEVTVEKTDMTLAAQGIAVFAFDTSKPDTVAIRTILDKTG